MMKAIVLNALHQPLTMGEIKMPEPAKDQALVRIQSAALNHRDLFITEGLYAGIQCPAILGSDGAGEYKGKQVLIYPALDWGDNPAFQGKSFRVLGMPDQGTFAEYIAVPKSHVLQMPEHLNVDQGAALPLAGLTAWRTLFSRCAVQSGEKVLITGVGGGVALNALQFAVAAGAMVFVTSGSDDKIQRAVQMGAKGGANYHSENWDKQLKQEAGGFDVIIDAAGGDGFARFPAMCNPGARIGFYGATLGKVNGLSLQPVFWKQISMLGSTMGSLEEFKAMLRFVQKHQLIPVVDRSFPFSGANEAFAYLKGAHQFGKIVLSGF